MKFIIRRIVVGVVSIPFVSGAYVFGYLALLLAGATPNASVEDVFYNGVNVGIVFALVLVFYPQFSRIIEKIIS